MTTVDDEDRLWELYKVAVDEYRFQVELNWKRSQYFFALNVAILVAGIGLLSSVTEPEPVLAAAPFCVGILFSVLSILAAKTQNAYYRAARDTKGRVEKRLDLGELAIATTPGMGAETPRFARVTTMQYAILGVLGGADLAGAVYGLCCT